MDFTFVAHNGHIQIAAHTTIGTLFVRIFIGYNGFWFKHIRKAEVGQACTGSAAYTIRFKKFLPSLFTIWASNPLPAMLSTISPCTSSQALTQRKQLMHFEKSGSHVRVVFVFFSVQMIFPFRIAHIPHAHFGRHAFAGSVAVHRRSGSQLGRWHQLHNVLAQFTIRSLCVYM